MLYLKTVRQGEDNTIAVSPIGDHYTLHSPGSSLYDFKVEEGDISWPSCYGILTYDRSGEENGYQELGGGPGVCHYIIHSNGSTFQKL